MPLDIWMLALVVLLLLMSLGYVAGLRRLP